MKYNSYHFRLKYNLREYYKPMDSVEDHSFSLITNYVPEMVELIRDDVIVFSDDISDEYYSLDVEWGKFVVK